jgi:acyl-coenzyme A thioesterase PaaI-like protein
MDAIRATANISAATVIAGIRHNTRRRRHMNATGDVRHRQPNSHGCFICGLANPIGLKMVFHEDQQKNLVRADLTVPETYRSYPGVVHGGIVATILDETSGRAIMSERTRAQVGEDPFFATARIEVRYRQAAPTNTPLVAVGWVEQLGPNRSRVKGELRLRDGTVLAECTSLVVRPPSEFLARWGEEAAYWRVYSDEELDRAGAQR